MPPRPLFPHLLLRILRHLLLVLDAVLGARAGELRARLAALPVGHRKRARLEGEMRRLARMRAVLTDPGLLDDAAFRGKAAEVARVRNDAGRRALARRFLYPTRVRRLRGARAPAAWSMAGGRCTCGIAIA